MRSKRSLWRLDWIGAALIVRRFPRAKAPARRFQHISVMKIRARKFVGTVALLVLVVVWSLLGMTLAQTPWLAASGLYQAMFYVVAGIGWVVPAMPIVSWMSRRDV